jgi:hypothetical protein
MRMQGIAQRFGQLDRASSGSVLGFHEDQSLAPLALQCPGFASVAVETTAKGATAVQLRRWERRVSHSG